uniref:Kinesin-like protein KIF11 n=1 Tax=Ascaris suum TaxID=6253 RepID=F1KTY1_ASCSU
MNTLEYASSAKNIKNHPEINQKLSRRALLRQYNDELEKLKRDLQAARDKTGIYLDKENFEEMQARLSDQTEQIDDLTDKLSATMSQLQTLMQDIEVMDEHYARAYERCLHLTEKLKVRNDEIAALKLELAETKSQLKDQKKAVSLLQDAGDSSQSQAVELIRNCVSLSGDLDLAIDKVDFLRDICAKNSAQLEDLHRDQTLEAQSLVKQTDEWNKFTQEQSSLIDSHCSDLLERLENGASTLSEHIAKLACHIERSTVAMEDAMKVAYDEAVEACGVHADNVVGAIENMKLLHGHCVHVFRALVEETDKRLDNLCQQHAALGKSIETYLSDEKRLNDQLLNERINQQKRLTELKEDFRLKLESMTANFFASYDSMASEMISAVDKEGEERSLRSSTFYAMETAQLNTGSVEMKELRCAASNATAELEQKAASFTDSENKLLADVLERKTQEIAKSESLKSSLERYSTEMRSFTTAECQLADENVALLVKAVKDSTAEVADTAALIASSGESSLNKVKETVAKSQKEFNDFISNKFERVTSTGRTPVRITREFPTEPVEIPDASQLLQEWANNAPPVGRRSFYRPRESLLEVPSNVLSPQTLKGVRPKLEDVPEQDSEDEENVPEKARGSNVTRRRPHFSILK